MPHITHTTFEDFVHDEEMAKWYDSTSPEADLVWFQDKEDGPMKHRPMTRFEKLRRWLWHKTPMRLRFWYSKLRYWWQTRECQAKGHDWIEHGYATPDSGAIDMTCARCGEYYHHQLY